MRTTGSDRDPGTPPITINGTTVERVSSLKFLGVHISEDLTWTHHTDTITKTARQQLFFLRRLRRFHMDTRIHRNFYRGTVERILTGCIPTWYGSCSTLNLKPLQRVVTNRIIKDPHNPSNILFQLLPSGRSYRWCETCKLLYLESEQCYNDIHMFHVLG